MSELLFLGLDGASWTVLRPLIEQGKLPHLAKLCDEGAHGPLRTTDPPYTFPAWKVISSGKRPDQLGVYGWIGVDWVRQQFAYPDARSFNTPEVWDHMAEAGRRVATVNMPATWPVRPLASDGVMAAGPFARDDHLFSPADAPERFALGAYEVDVPLAFRGDPQGALELFKRLEGQRFEVSERLAGEVDVLFHTVFYCDPIQHYHWDDAGTLEAAWTWLDSRIGSLLEAADPEHVVVASDHGFTRVTHQLNVNTWLQERGLLELEGTQATGLLQRLGLTRERVLRVTGALGISEQTLERLIPLSIRRGVPSEDGGLTVNRLALIDWHRTRALSADGFQVYVRDQGARDEILEGLRALTLPGTDQAAFHRVWDPREDGAAGNPPVVLTPTDGVKLAHAFGGDLWKSKGFSGGWTATHGLEGVLLGHGPRIPAGSTERANLVDIAPTLLALLDLPRPEEMEGELLFGLDDPGTRDRLPAPFERTTVETADSLAQARGDV